MIDLQPQYKYKQNISKR